MKTKFFHSQDGMRRMQRFGLRRRREEAGPEIPLFPKVLGMDPSHERRKERRRKRRISFLSFPGWNPQFSPNSSPASVRSELRPPKVHRRSHFLEALPGAVKAAATAAAAVQTFLPPPPPPFCPGTLESRCPARPMGAENGRGGRRTGSIDKTVNVSLQGFP